MKTQYYTACSLDGFIATEDHSLEWLFQLGDAHETSYAEFIGEVGAIAMGSSTYEWLRQQLLKPDESASEPWPYSQPTWVFTRRTLPSFPGANLRFARGDVRPVHEQMAAAAAGKNIWVVGGGELVGQFHDAGLLDELILQVGSVTLGSGRPLLPRAIVHPPMELVSAQRLSAGLAELRYRIGRTTGQ